MNDTEQRYHSNKQESSPSSGQSQTNSMNTCRLMGKIERVCSPDGQQPAHLYLFSMNLDAAGQRWVAQLASYNFP